MKRLVIKVSNKTRHPHKHRTHKITVLNHSKDVDNRLLIRFLGLNTIACMDVDSKLFSCENDIKYFTTLYVGMLRNNIIRLYEKSEDPIEVGEIHKSNLEFCLDYVKNIYDDIKPKRRKIFYKAAFLLYHLNVKHPFVDGNKRTSIVTCNSFLEYNGYSLMMPFRKSHEFIIELAKGNRTEQECRFFIVHNIMKIKLHQSSKRAIKKILEEASHIKKNKKT